MTNDLWRWQAGALAQAIKTGFIKSREAVEACLARLEQVNPKINAVIDALATRRCVPLTQLTGK